MKKWSFSFAVLFALAVFLIVAHAGWTQRNISGEIAGFVTDPSGASVPNAPVMLKSVDSGKIQNTITGDSGAFRFPLLKPGPYTLTAEVAGFERITLSDVVVSLGQVTNVSIVFAIGKATKTVEVTAHAPLSSTEMRHGCGMAAI